MDSNNTRDPIEEEVEFQEDSLDNASLIRAGGLGGTREINVRDQNSKAFGEGGKSRFRNLLVESWTTENIHILLAW